MFNVYIFLMILICFLFFSFLFFLVSLCGGKNVTFFFIRGGKILPYGILTTERVNV